MRQEIRQVHIESLPLANASMKDPARQYSAPGHFALRGVDSPRLVDEISSRYPNLAFFFPSRTQKPVITARMLKTGNRTPTRSAL